MIVDAEGQGTKLAGELRETVEGIDFLKCRGLGPEATYKNGVPFRISRRGPGEGGSVIVR